MRDRRVRAVRAAAVDDARRRRRRAVGAPRGSTSGALSLGDEVEPLPPPLSSPQVPWIDLYEAPGAVHGAPEDLARYAPSKKERARPSAVGLMTRV